jgi:bifunctional enzyme CysN/CysC
MRAAVAPVIESLVEPVAAGPRRSQSLLRFITCGSVDDGKSTLIGRLLVEAGAVPDDVFTALEADSATLGSAGPALDYALLVDGLQAEREQGITIDVAYRYFATPRRSFIVADTPGHDQYTRNMATGASGAELAVILIDARKGVLPQTRRHSLIVSLVGVRHVVVAINKTDLIGFDEAAIRGIEQEYRAAVAELAFQSITVIPVSAREGDNIACLSPRMPWYRGPTLLGWLETVETTGAAPTTGFAMPVQWVNRPGDDFRGFAGTIASGTVRPGDGVLALPSGERATVARIVTFDGDLIEAGTGQAVTLTLDREIDISRGDVLTASQRSGPSSLAPQTQIIAQLFVTANRSISAGDSFGVQIGTASATARVVEILHKTDVASFSPHPAAKLSLNELGRVRLHLDKPMVVSPYASLRALGALILVDRLTHATAAMGVIVAQAPQTATADRASAFQRVVQQRLEAALGPHWRQETGPAVSWWLASAGLLGLIVTLAANSFAWGAAAMALDAALRPLARLAHRRVWKRLRSEASGADGTVQEGGGI